MTVKFQHLTEALQFYDPEFYDYLKDRQVRGAVVRGRPDVTVEKRPLPATHPDTQTVCRVATKTPPYRNDPACDRTIQRRPRDRVTHTCIRSVPELANLGGKQHPMDIVFPLFPSKLTMDFPLSSTENIIICNN